MEDVRRWSSYFIISLYTLETHLSLLVQAQSNKNLRPFKEILKAENLNIWSWSCEQQQAAASRQSDLI